MTTDLGGHSEWLPHVDKLILHTDETSRRQISIVNVIISILSDDNELKTICMSGSIISKDATADEQSRAIIGAFNDISIDSAAGIGQAHYNKYLHRDHASLVTGQKSRQQLSLRKREPFMLCQRSCKIRYWQLQRRTGINCVSNLLHHCKDSVPHVQIKQQMQSQ